MILVALALLQTPASVTYQDMKIEGWTVHVEMEIIAKRPKTWEAARKQLQSMLIQVERTVPDGPLGKLKTVPFWIHLNNPANPGAAYHPSREWLTEHKFNPSMARGIEFGVLDNLVTWSYHQPWMALHELAHAYHHQFLPDSFDNKDVASAFDAAVSSGKYDSILWYDGRLGKHYAISNRMEYFAETSEAYFGTNDGFPFVRVELKNFDPKGYELMVKMWGQPVVKKPSG
jgi:hypothetical protein